MEKTLFGLQGTQLLVTCTHMAIRGHKDKAGKITQYLDMKLETLIAPDRMVGSPFIESAFEVTPLPKSKQAAIEGAEPAPVAKYLARPGSKVTVGQSYKEFSLLFNDNNDGELMTIVDDSHMLTADENGLRMWPAHGIKLTEIELDEDKKTGSPLAKLIFMVKGLPAGLASIPWLEFEMFELDGVIKTETEINEETKAKKAAKSAPGQETVPDPEEA